jgi:hypothetical protein
MRAGVLASNDREKIQQRAKELYAIKHDGLRQAAQVRFSIITVGTEGRSILESAQKATSLHKRLAEGADFNKLAQSESDDPRAKQGETTFTLRRVDIADQNLQKRIFARVKDGTLLEPFTAGANIYLVKILEFIPEQTPEWTKAMAAAETIATQELRRRYRESTNLYLTTSSAEPKIELLPIADLISNKLSEQEEQRQLQEARRLAAEKSEKTTPPPTLQK